MYSLLPFGRYTNNSLNSLLDDFDRSFFPLDRSQMPAFRTDLKYEGEHFIRERRVGSFTRSFNVSGIQEDAISASYENGVLKLTLPKEGEPEPQSRKIAIQ